MKRTLIAGLLLVALVFGAGAFFWYFAYGTGRTPPARATLASLSAPVTVRWQENGTARIEAQTPADAAAALGYVHGTQRLWSLVLWRQTALGRLGEWFGRGLLPFDRHARRLGLHALAREAYAQLPDSTQRLLAAYADGVNAALQGDALQRNDELVLLELAPDPWQPWHALAVERLIAWLATVPPPDTALAAADNATLRFFETDARFRRWLHLYGFERSVAWALEPEADSPVLFQRHVFGTSALPLLYEVALDGPNGEAVTGGSLPGTPFFPAGRAGPHAWSLLLSSPLTLAFAPVDSAALATAHERIRLRDGDEVLLVTHRTPETLPLGHPDPRPLDLDALALPDTLAPADSAATVDSVRTRRRSVWQVRWPGFRPVTDATAWPTLATSAPAPFRLFEGRGLHVASGGSARVLGRPPTVERFAGGVLVGQSAWAPMQARSLRARWSPAARPALAALSANDSSAWAAERLADVMPLLRMTAPADARLREAMAYLRNWNHTYDRASIGASLFEAWMRAHRAETDALPQAPDHARLAPPEDSLAFAAWTDSLRADSLKRAAELRRTFRRAVDSLAAAFGPDPRRWRWERVGATPRYFPVWSADSLVGRDLRGLSATRYAPIERPGQGHPSAPAGGISLLDPAPYAAAAWEAWTTPDPDAPFVVRRDRMRTDAFLGQHTAPDRRPDPFPLRVNAAPRAVTVLRPAP
mgnify:CR=1 FL=1